MDPTSTPGAGPSTPALPPPSQLNGLPTSAPQSATAHQRRPSSSSALAPPSTSAAAGTSLSRSTPAPSAAPTPPAQISYALPAAPTFAGGSSVASAAAGPSTAPPPPPPALDPRRPEAAVDEARLIGEGVRSRVFLMLARDQHATFAPDVTAFADHADVLRRLVPYHVWQAPEDDLHGPLGAPSARKGKGRAREADEQEAEEQERAELKEAFGFAKRKRKLDKRFAQLRQREGLHASPSEMAICLSREVANDDLPSIAKMRTETSHARARLTILTAQIEQIRNPAPPAPAPRPPAPVAAPPAPGPGGAVAQPVYRPPQGYPGTPIYRPAPGGGTFQPSKPLPLSGPGPSTPTTVRPPAGPASSVGRPPAAAYRPPPSGYSATPVGGAHTLGRPPLALPPAPGPADSSARPPPGAVRPPPPTPVPATSAVAGQPAAARKPIDIHAPAALSVPITFLPNLQAAGILPDPTASPPTPGLATDVVVDAANVRFTVVLASLAGDRIRTLSEVLSLAHGAEARARAKAAEAAA